MSNDAGVAEWRRLFTQRPTEAGWYGIFTRFQSEGAIPNGEAIVKVNSEPGDSVPDGERGKVLGSLPNIPAVSEEAKRKGIRPPDAYWYFVEWASRPRCAIQLIDWKIRRADGR